MKSQAVALSTVLSKSLASLRFLLLDNNDLSRDLEQRIAAFVSHCNSARYHDSLDNLTPADVHSGRAGTILGERQRIRRETLKHGRLQRHLKVT